MTLYLLIAPSGAGKTSWARKKSEETGAIHISSDACRFIVSGSEENQECSPQAFELARKMVSYFLYQEKDVIMDSTALTPRTRSEFVQIGRNFGARVVAVWFKTPIEVCKERNKNRSRTVPDDVIDKQFARLVPPQHHYFDEIIEINA